jgi:hypothetical protein
MRKTLALTTAGLLAAAAVATWNAGDVVAADHAEAPAVQAAPAADIADFFAWQTDGGAIASVITFAPLTAAGGNFTCDNTVLYTVHTDFDADNVSDQQVHVRFGTTDGGDCGMQVTVVGGLNPGVLEGATETVLNDAALGLTAWAGLADDPFFFDLQGYQDTLATDTLAFTGVDAFAGTNVSAIVVEFPANPTAPQFQTWATTSTI